MKLYNVYFRAFKSLVNCELIIEEDCLGLVGINESGKTNILDAINVLGNNRILNIKDSPKINRELPEIKFSFHLDKSEKEIINKTVNEWQQSNSISDSTLLSLDEINIHFEVKLDSLTNAEVRNFSLTGVKLLHEGMVLIREKIEVFNALLESSAYLPINKPILISPSKINEVLESLNSSKPGEEFLTLDFLKQFYTTSEDEVNNYLITLLVDKLKLFLPKVVFWENNSNYILRSETSFSELISKTELSEISRPMLNIFRIGLDISNIDDLKNKISEIQNDPNERSKLEKILNRKINSFISEIWKDYKQELNITLEKEQIRIEIFDPKNENASYFNMEERSQGCKTFLSFLMTVGAEAKYGVISNYILLLDEPENHLHPSGVRFMLQELIKISENNNVVIYATHSIFLIDRKKFRRHIIVSKEKERTRIKSASDGRIGYFMQEEVLYSTLDIDLSSEFSIGNKYNFVFEGDGDVILFQKFYEKYLEESERPYAIRQTSFHQGGKCSDIFKYFKQRPIQLGTKWVFILDKDKPADILSDFLKSHYRDYIGRDIFIFQYKKEGLEIEVVLEDLLEISFIEEVITETAGILEVELGEIRFAELSKSGQSFSSYFDEMIEKDIEISKREEFKGRFKERLNFSLRAKADNVLNKQDFSSLLPVYYRWFSEIFDPVNNNFKVSP